MSWQYDRYERRSNIRRSDDMELRLNSYYQVSASMADSPDVINASLREASFTQFNSTPLAYRRGSEDE